MNKIFNTLIELMNLAEEMKELDGAGKKQYVLDHIKEILNEEAYERYSPFIEFTIDGLIEITRKNLKIFVHKRKLCLSCITNNL